MGLAPDGLTISSIAKSQWEKWDMLALKIAGMK
jgi:hypothetical protein